MIKLKMVRAKLARFAERVLEPHILFPFLALMALAMVWGATFHFISIEKERAVDTAMDSSAELIETYEAQMVRNLATIDQTLRTTKYAYELKRTRTVLAELNEKSLLPPALVFTVSIIDRNGEVIASTRPDALDSVDGEQFFLSRMESNRDVLFVSPPMREADGQEWRVKFSRRLSAADGSFDGVVMVSAEPAYFTSGYERSRLGDRGVLGLFVLDGTFLAKRTGEKISWGEAAGITVEDIGSDRRAAPAMLNPWDGVRRYTHMSKIHGFPLAVAVGLSEEEQLAAFEESRRGYLWNATAASALALAVLAAMGFMSWQLSTNRHRTRKAQETYYAASDASLDAFFVLRSVSDAKGGIDDFVLEDTNWRGAALFGYPKEKLIGKSLSVAFPKSRQNGVFDEFVNVVQNKSMHESEWENRDPRIRAGWLHRQIVSVEDGVVAILRDITERKHAEALRSGQARVLEMIATGTPLQEVLQSLLQLIASQVPGMMGSILLLEKDGAHLVHGAAVNLPQKFTRAIDGLSVGANAGCCGTAVYRREPVTVADIGQDPLCADYRGLASEHGLRACWSAPILSHQDKVLGTFAMYYREVREPTIAERQLVGIASRIAGIAIERKLAEDRIHYMAHHDPLTGLPNRSLLDDRVEQAMLYAQRYGRQLTVMFIDLDNFKLINDSLGHNAGDELLKTVAQRMVQSVRSTDTVLRLGGDEFVIVLLDQGDNASAVSSPLQKIHDAIAQPMTLAGKEVQVTCSMGLAAYPDDGTDSDTLLMHADAAMYRAKELGRNNYQFYTADMNRQVQEKLAMQEGLRNAIMRNELFLVYQPQVDLRSGKIIGTEALIRWQHPELGVVSPVKFIPLAEETGLIVSIGDWVLRTACRQNKAWQEAGMPPSVVSVNVSARQFREGNLISRVAHALEESGLQPKYLALELTESLIMQDLQQALETMDKLQSMGVQLSIDDFGTGYSSLSALKKFPIARLKLDRSFVSDLPHDHDDKAIAMAVISLGHQLNLRVVAEGIETQEQLTFLRDNGCDEMQGYYFSKPVSPNEIATLFLEQASLTLQGEVHSAAHG
jgi:diguanylate cyclase (GGDEF)-like protein/PAS domain S-box-containing protein